MVTDLCLRISWIVARSPQVSSNTDAVRRLIAWEQNSRTQDLKHTLLIILSALTYARPVFGLTTNTLPPTSLPLLLECGSELLGHRNPIELQSTVTFLCSEPYAFSVKAHIIPAQITHLAFPSTDVQISQHHTLPVWLFGIHYEIV